jgi:hypothetical protein
MIKISVKVKSDKYLRMDGVYSSIQQMYQMWAHCKIKDCT